MNSIQRPKMPDVVKNSGGTKRSIMANITTDFLETSESQIEQVLESVVPKIKEVKIEHVLENYNPDMDLTKYEERLKQILSISKTKREQIKNLAIFLSSEFPKLPYLEGDLSGHDGTDLTGLEWIKEPVNTSVGHRTLDCSGLVNWCFENAGLEIPSEGRTWDYSEYVGSENISSIVGNNLENVEPGDFALNPNYGGHMGVIVDVNKEAHELTVVHTSHSGGGVNITTINTDNGQIVKDDTGSSGVDRTGRFNYFTEILHVPYPDE